MLDGLFKNKYFVETIALFKEMEEKNMDCNIMIYNILIDCMCNVGEVMIAREFFYSLATKGLQPDVWTYSIMIKELCKEGLIDEASELLEKMERNGCSPHDCTFNTIIQGLLQHNETSRQ